MADMKILNGYKNLMKQMGYKIIYDGSDPARDSGVFFLIKISNPDNPTEPKYAFYEIFMGADLSLDGFEHTVLVNKNTESFMKMVDARIKGCTLSKSEVLCGMLKNGYLIDDVYDKPKIKFPKSAIKVVSSWVNFQGGMNPRKRGEAPRTK